jgi:hypothetical protein
MLFWPKLDRWPPSKKVWIAAAILAFVVTPAAMLIGTVGHVILGAIVVVCLVLGANARLKRLDAEGFSRSGPDN